MAPGVMLYHSACQAVLVHRIRPAAGKAFGLLRTASGLSPMPATDRTMEEPMSRQRDGWRRGVAAAAAVLAAALLGAGCASTPPAAHSAGMGRIEPIDSFADWQRLGSNSADRYMVVYHSPRCGFCAGMLRGMHRNLADFGPAARIYTVDIDANPDIQSAMGIGPVPVVTFHRGGTEVNRWRSARPSFVVRRSVRSFFGAGSR